MNDAGTALRETTPELGSFERKIVAQDVEHRCVRVGIDDSRFAIYREVVTGHAVLPGSATVVQFVRTRSDCSLAQPRLPASSVLRNSHGTRVPPIAYPLRCASAKRKPDPAGRGCRMRHPAEMEPRAGSVAPDRFPRRQRARWLAAW